MLKITTEKRDVIYINNADETKATFAVLKDCLKIIGMVIKEKEGWTTRIHSHNTCSGYYPTFQECISHDLAFYDFYQDLYVK